MSHIPSSLMTALRSLGDRFTSTSSSGESSLLPFIPKPIKVVLLLLLITHSPSWPFMWHIRVWYHGIHAYYMAYMKGRSRYLVDWKAQSNKKGGVRGLRVRHKRIAGMDDCDYNMHLSNSSYAKNSDAIKMDICIQAFSPAFTPGAHMALGATHYNFFKEIPIGAEYTMEASIAGWDEKWLFFACEFIIYPKKPSRGRIATEKTTSAISSAVPQVVPSISDPPTRTGSPAPSKSASAPATPSQLLGNNIEDIKKVWAQKKKEPRADGGVVCCLSISEYCFKMGRVTIPPRIALWISLQSPRKEEQDRARAILMSKDGGKAFLRGGWKEEPNSEALGTDIGLEEGERLEDSWVVKGAGAMESVVSGMSAF